MFTQAEIKMLPVAEVNDPEFVSDLKTFKYLCLPGPQYTQIFHTEVTWCLGDHRWNQSRSVRPRTPALLKRDLLDTLPRHLETIAQHATHGSGYKGISYAEGDVQGHPIRTMHGKKVFQTHFPHHKRHFNKVMGPPGLVALRTRALFLNGPLPVHLWDDDGEYIGPCEHSITWRWTSELALGFQSDASDYDKPTLQELAEVEIVKHVFW